MEQRYQAVLEVLNSGATVIDVARRNRDAVILHFTGTRRPVSEPGPCDVTLTDGVE